MAYPRFISSRNIKIVNDTSGNNTVNSSSWTNVKGSTYDIELNAQTNDVIEYGISLQWGNEALTGYLDVATVVDGSYVNFFCGNGVDNGGAIGWLGVSGSPTAVVGSVMYELAAADITDDNTVILRLIYKGSSAGNKTINASSTAPLQVWARNIGPQDPN